MKKSAGPKYAQKPKKPFYKKWWFWVIVVFVLVAAFGGSDSPGESATVSTQPSQAVTETAAPDALDLDVTFFSEFRNDITGRWRKALVATSSQIQEYALDYYREYFKADDEVHVIYNFSLNTVNCLTVTGNTLCINITDYVDGEEHDAKIACGGTFLGTYQIDLSTGEITYSSFDK